MKKWFLIFVCTFLFFSLKAQKSILITSTFKPADKSQIEKTLGLGRSKTELFSKSREMVVIDRDSIYTDVDEVASFQGGNENMKRFIAQNLVRPKGSKGETVLVKFLIERYGEINKVHIVESSGNPLVSAEAIRVIKKMGAWNPAKVNGVEVASFYVLPISF
ncbi:energy transducer TonB [Flectobacillus major]|uniref:energy transducer TonB n=1 Tax=Flectobacillus major TaxID=103 RepID=UPI00042159BF|nr:TonB family protein [Flectobacillus major]